VFLIIWFFFGKMIFLTNGKKKLSVKRNGKRKK